jgi:hypothetical protein
MKSFTTCIGALLWTGAAWASTPSPALPGDAAAWSRAAEADIRAAYQLLVDNHPGMVDPDNPGFPAQLRQARDAALALAPKVVDATAYSAALAHFDVLLGDGHAGVSATLPAGTLPARRWPGFSVEWRGQGPVVVQSIDTAVPRGARILGCDGESAQAVVRRVAFAQRGRPGEAGQWWVRGRDAFVDVGNPLVQVPRECDFELPGRRWSHTLAWRVEAGSEGEQFRRWRVAAYNGDVQPIGLTMRPDGLAWIAMPTFNPDDAEVRSYQQLDANLLAQQAGVRAATAVVLDLRGNQGGSSQWSRNVAARLWSRQAVDAAVDDFFANLRTRWRVTPGNHAYVAGEVPQIRAKGHAALADSWQAIADGIGAARVRGEPLFEEASRRRATSPGKVSPTDDRARPPPVFVITPGQCSSACLDALDIFTRLPGVTLIGAPTSGDSKYMDVYRQATPSGLAQVTIPAKLLVGRPRGHGQGYSPAIVVDDLDWSTEAFARVVHQALAQRNGQVTTRP